MSFDVHVLEHPSINRPEYLPPVVVLVMLPEKPQVGVYAANGPSHLLDVFRAVQP